MNIGRRWLAATALACAVGTAQAAAPAVQRSLEDAFWACDYIATTHGTAAAAGEACVAAYEEFKAAKFGGNFEELVAWWQLNKADAHARMHELAGAAPVEPVASAPAEGAAERTSRATRLLAATRAYFSEIAAVLRSD